MVFKLYNAMIKKKKRKKMKKINKFHVHPQYLNLEILNKP